MTTFTDAELIDRLRHLVGEDQVSTDEAVLKDSSLDFYRKYEKYHQVYQAMIPVAIVFAKDVLAIQTILIFANDNHLNVVPRSGNSGVESGLMSGTKQTIILDGSGLTAVKDFDFVNMQVTVSGGIVLEALENELRALGYTTGHSPQSKPLAQMGGLVATRSIGQFSTLYGGIEDMVVGLEAVFPNGTITRIKNVPRRAAGPDIRHVLIGNEGTIAYITEVTIKIWKYRPENNHLFAYTLDDFKMGFDILREVMIEGYKPSVARLYDVFDASTHFASFQEGKNVLIFMTEGPADIAETTAKSIKKIVANYGLESVDTHYIEAWFNQLNWHPESITKEAEQTLQLKVVGYTTEISAVWGDIHAIYESVIKRVIDEIPDLYGVGGHSSHSYINGTNLYFVYAYHVNCPPEEEAKKYHDPLNKIIVEETLKYGGSMCHHHGVGKARAPYIKEEYGSSYYILKELMKTFDPNNVMNAGTIIPIEMMEEK